MPADAASIRLRDGRSLAYATVGDAQDELIITTRPWGFRVDEIRVPVHLWHGELDMLVPVESARYVARTIPNCEAGFFPDEGHLLSFGHSEEILRTLVESFG